MGLTPDQVESKLLFNLPDQHYNFLLGLLLSKL